MASDEDEPKQEPIDNNLLNADGEKTEATANPPSQGKLRKRTKTGCLTCRKRRIKCGEERPVCNNCIKSKRNCEGYSQRVVWKAPLEWSHGHPGVALTHHTSLLPGERGQQQHPHHPQYPPPIQIPNGQYNVPGYPGGYPYPVPPMGYNVPITPMSAQTVDGNVPPFGLSVAIPQPGQASVQAPLSAPLLGNTGFNVSVNVSFPPQAGQGVEIPMPLNVQQTTHYHDPRHYSLAPQQQNFQIQQPMVGPQQTTPVTAQFPAQQQGFPIPQSAFPPAAGVRSFTTTGRYPPQIVQPNIPSTSLPFVAFEMAPQMIEEEFKARVMPEHQHLKTQPKVEEVEPQVTAALPTTEPQPAMTYPFYQPSQYPKGFSPIMPAQLLEEAAVEIEDDDYYDVMSEDEMDEAAEAQYMALGPSHSRKDFGLIMALHRESNNEISMRRYDTFIYEGILDTYRAEWVANPLKNKRTARVFAHFCHATGPSLSIYERNPRNTSAIFTGDPVPYTQQSLWTYKLPMMALNHQGMLHAMLALASLHIAKLQGASTTPSFKHYAYSLKRIHHCVTHPRKRYMITTLAATLLLGFYEVMTADHNKWSTHLVGAKQLIVELDFKRMTQEYRRLKIEERMRRNNFAYDHPDMVINQRQLSQNDVDINIAIDESLVSTIIGKKLKYDEFGRVVEDEDTRRHFQRIPAGMDLSKYELFQDLFWWYCRQDAYHSIISGNKLLMDYSRWSECPPRACMGKADAVYGTHDHLILLLGRIADFAATDRERKVKVMEASGGQWRPHPSIMHMLGMSGQRGGPQGKPPQGQPPQGQGGPMPGQAPPHGQAPTRPPGPPQGGPPNGPSKGPPQMPSFYGMAPSSGRTHMPSAFASNKPPSPGSPQRPQRNRFDDLSAATEAAIEEWTQIKAAIQNFAPHFGPQYQTLPPKSYQPLICPFGEALQYRSYDIAVLWALYHMCQIIHIRSHPHMPPAATMAAGVAASQTAWLANEIGRIAAGIIPAPQNQPMNPSLGASLCEATMPLFFAGVQYQNPEQRAWLVTRCLDIGKRTGWESASMIALGCETGWERAFEAGRGPPYTRVRDENSKDERYSGKGAHVTGEPPRDPADRRFVHFSPGARAHWAMGLLSLEDDVRDPKADIPQPPLGQRHPQWKDTRKEQPQPEPTEVNQGYLQHTEPDNPYPQPEQKQSQLQSQLQSQTVWDENVPNQGVTRQVEWRLAQPIQVSAAQCNTSHDQPDTHFHNQAHWEQNWLAQPIGQPAEIKRHPDTRTTQSQPTWDPGPHIGQEDPTQPDWNPNMPQQKDPMMHSNWNQQQPVQGQTPWEQVQPAPPHAPVLGWDEHIPVNTWAAARNSFRR